MQTKPILQNAIPNLPWHSKASGRLPGVQPLDPADWIWVDDAYGAQMALRSTLLDTRRSDVIAYSSGSAECESVLLEEVMDALRKQSGFAVGDGSVRCPDGRVVEISDTDPLSTIGRLVQEDFCLLQKRGGEHVLVAAVLCFPAGWTLAEKLGKPLGRIHAPVQSYDEKMAIRVQRLFDAVQTGNPLWRVNALAYEKPWLFQPRREADAGSHRPSGATFLRSELQTIRVLRDAKTIAFGIHTYVTDLASLPASDQLAFEEWARGETRA